MKIRDIINSKKTPETKKSVAGITGKHKFNGNFNTDDFLVEKARAKKKKKKAKEAEESKEETAK